MEYIITLVTVKPVKLYTMATPNEPHNIKVGWPVFQRMLGKPNERTFYGLQTGSLGTGTYRFGATMLQDDMLEQFEQVTLQGGLYASVRLTGKDKLDHIAPAFAALIDVYETTIDSIRPRLEYYKDDSTIEVMQPIKPQEGTRPWKKNTITLT
jgi:hypothetical protein